MNPISTPPALSLPNQSLFRLPAGFSIDKGALLRLLFVVGRAALFLWGNDVFADQLKLPTGDTDLGIPGVAANDSWGKKIVMAIAYIIIIMALLGLGLILVNVLFSLAGVSDDARSQDGGMVLVLKKIGIVVTVVVLGILIFTLINSYILDPIYKMFS